MSVNPLLAAMFEKHLKLGEKTWVFADLSLESSVIEGLLSCNELSPGTVARLSSLIVELRAQTPVRCEGGGNSANLREQWQDAVTELDREIAMKVRNNISEQGTQAYLLLDHSFE